MPRWVPILVALGLTLPEAADAQVYVAPRRPGKSLVRYFDYDWQHVDLLVGEEVEGKESPGVRLFFYEAERESAERAASTIEDAYRYLADTFDYTPDDRFPYILYSSYQEYLRTNLFPLQEGVLGVTSTRGDLEVTLPYFGDHRRFEEVSTHELAHQFTIQKVRSLAKAQKASLDPLEAFPLWFIEGLAEYYAKRGLDPEAEMLLRDIVANPNLYDGWGLLDFPDDFPGSVLWTYKVGQARIAFLEETYGEGVTQRILDASPMLGQGSRFGFKSRPKSFGDLLEHVTGDDLETITVKFEDWAKRKVFAEYLGASQDRSEFEALDDVRGWLTAIDAAPGGEALLYRSIDFETGRSRLWLVDPRSPRTARRVAVEGVPGAESLHPVEDRNFDLGRTRIVYVSESRGHDVLNWRTLTHTAEERTSVPPGETVSLDVEMRDGPQPEPEPEPWWDVRFDLGPKKHVRLSEHGIIGAFSPSLSPDEARIAFVGLTVEGTKDVFTLDLESRELTRVTSDVFAERHVSWGPDGIVFDSDATEHGRYNLFLARDGGGVERLTTEATDHFSPSALADGRIHFHAYSEGGHADLQAWTPDGVVRRTDVVTGLLDATSGPGEDVWALFQHEGRKLPVQVPAAELRDAPPRPQPEPPGPAQEYAERTLADAVPYQPLSPSNWRGENLFGYLGAGGSGVYGQVYASATDQLRDHALVLAANIYGSFALTDGYLLYMNQSKRTIWGGGPFQSLRFRIEETDGDLLFQSAERFTGGTISARYPFNRFVYLQADQAIGATTYFLPQNVGFDLERLEPGAAREWDTAYGKTRLQTETTLRLGLDTVQYHRRTGPISGGAILLDTTLGAQPIDDGVFGNTRADAQQYFPIPFVPGGSLGFRAAAGTSFGGRPARSFWLSSYDTLRGVYISDFESLLGRHFWFGSGEVQLPLDGILRVAFASSIEAVAGFDVGAASDELDLLWDRRIADVALGANFIFAPLVLRVHFATPIDIGAPLPSSCGESGCVWVPNVSLTWMQSQ